MVFIFEKVEIFVGWKMRLAFLAIATFGLLCVFSLEAISKDSDFKVIRKIILKQDQEKNFKATEIHGPFISGNYALVVCVYGEMGGESIFIKKSPNNWQELMSGGGSFGQEGLIEAGVPKQNAQSIMQKSADYWKKKRNVIH